MRNLEEFPTLSNHDKAVFLYGIEADFDDHTIDFLLNITKDKNEYDLVRIEAIKGVGLCAANSDAKRKQYISDILIELVQHDEDDDIRVYALQSLGWLTDLESIPGKIRDILLNKEEDVLVREAAYSVVSSQKHNPVSKDILTSLVEDPMFSRSAARDLI